MFITHKQTVCLNDVLTCLYTKQIRLGGFKTRSWPRILDGQKNVPQCPFTGLYQMSAASHFLHREFYPVVYCIIFCILCYIAIYYLSGIQYFTGVIVDSCWQTD